MSIRKLAHYSIRTQDLAASEKFYTEVMGFRVGYRPGFPFPGLWLYEDADESDYGIVHIIGVDPEEASGLVDYLGDRAGGDGTGALDHIAFLARHWREMRGRLHRMAVPYVERTVPTLGLLQVFLRDPSGVTIELNYPASEAS
ncbi:MAG: VOC family protein [Parvibaculum sedimenti]|uniref:VOC family protein n=1 Tax=Parvibaculum sedimenti TaxID=2608632 RepID=UPI003BB5346B